jgi:hypothetical protein
METYIVWTADKLDSKIAAAFHAGVPSEIAIINQRTNHGNSLLRGWIENGLGQVLLMNGPAGVAMVPDSILVQLSTIQAQISQLWEDTLSMGVSMSLQEANRACVVAKERGGNRVLWYTPDLDRPQGGNETDPLAGLKKAEEQSPNSQFMEVPQEQPAAGAPEAAPEAQPPASGGPDEIKNTVMRVLKQIKSQKKTLDQLRQAAPDTYNAILAAVQAMIVMARAMTEGGGGEEEPAPQDMSAGDQAAATQTLQEQAVSNEREVAMGMQEEMKEHGISEAEALKLAQDHIKLDGQYYSKRQGA